MGFKVSKEGKAKIILIIGILFTLFVVFSVAAIVYTERPEFCTTCHIMDPYYESWQASTHAEVNCIECHYDPGLKAHIKGKIVGLVQVAQYLTGRYSEKPKAEVSDAACLREGCHKKEELVNRTVEFGNTIEFAHAVHLESPGKDMRLRCTNCHSQSTYEEHIKVDTNTCFLCHFKNVGEDELSKQCLNCHKKIKAVGSHKEYIEEGMSCSQCHEEVKSGNAEVRRQVCYFCHEDRGTIDKIGDRALLHKAHIYENKVDCISCHDFIKHN